MEGPRGPDLVPTAANWSDWVGVMVTSHFGLVLGLLWAPRVPKRARFGPKCPFWGPWRSWEGPREPFESIQDPQKMHIGAKQALLEPLGAKKRGPYQAKVCGNHDSNPVRPICGNWDQIRPQLWPLEFFSQLRPVLGQKGPLGPPVITYKAPEWANMTYNHVS